MNCLKHGSTLCTLCIRVVWELEVRDLPCCNSSSFSITFVADWKALLSSSERLCVYWIAFWNASFRAGAGAENVRDGRFGGWFPVAWTGLGAVVGLARVLELIPVLGFVPELKITLLSREGSRGLAWVLPKDWPEVEVGLGLVLFDSLGRSGSSRDSRSPFLVSPEDILSWKVSCWTSKIHSAIYTYATEVYISGYWTILKQFCGVYECCSWYGCYKRELVFLRWGVITTGYSDWLHTSGAVIVKRTTRHKTYSALKSHQPLLVPASALHVCGVACGEMGGDGT